MAKFDYQKAKSDGYSDEQISIYLEKSYPTFNRKKAEQDGYTPDQINEYLSSYESPKKAPEREGSEQAARLGMQYTLGLADRAMLPLTLQSQILQSEDAQMAELRKNTFEDIERLAEQKSTGIWDEKDEELFQYLQEQIRNPELMKEHVKTGDISPSGLIKKGIKEAFDYDLQPENTKEHIAEFIGSFKPSELKYLLTKGPQKIKEAYTKMMKARPAKVSPAVTRGAAPGGVKEPMPGSMEIPAGRSGFELAEEALGELQKPTIEKGGKSLGLKVALGAEEAKPLTGRAKVLQEETARSISPERFYNEKHGGSNLSGLAKKELEKANKIVRKRYKAAEKEYTGKSDIFPGLATKTEEMLQSLAKTAEPSTAEKAVLKQLESLQKILGYPQALREIGLDRLIKTADSMSQLLNYEVAGGGVKNILKGFVKDINKSVIASLERQGAKAVKLKEADKAYAQMADRFFNDEMKGFLEKKIRNPESLYRKALQDEGTYRALRDALGPKNGKSIAKLERGIVEESITPYLKDTSKIGSKEYSQSMANLEGLIGKEKTAKIKSSLERKKVTTPTAIKEPKKKLPSEKVTSATQSKVSKYLGKTPEQIESMMNTRSGIKELRSDLNKKGLPKLFDQLAEEKMVSMMRGGDVAKKKITHADLYNEFNLNKNNYDVLVGLYEKPAADQFLETIAKAYQKDKFKRIGIDTIKVIARFMGLGKGLKIYSVLSKGL